MFDYKSNGVCALLGKNLEGITKCSQSFMQVHMFPWFTKKVDICENHFMPSLRYATGDIMKNDTDFRGRMYGLQQLLDNGPCAFLGYDDKIKCDNLTRMVQVVGEKEVAICEDHLTWVMHYINKPTRDKILNEILFENVSDK